MSTAFVIRKHPIKNKPLVTPCKSVARIHQLVVQLKQQKIPHTIHFPKRNISSGEDSYVQI